METVLQDDFDSSEKDLKDYLATVWRRKFQVLLTSGVLMCIAIALAFGLSSIYRSSSTILIEQQEIPQDLVRTTITSYTDQRIQTISQRVMTSANLWQIIDKYGLYKEMRAKKPREVVIEQMRKNINMDTISAEVVDPRSGRPGEATIAFSLAYESSSPSLAQKVANELTTLFLRENLKSRTQMAAETSGFLKEEGLKLEREINTLESKLAEFKQTNVNNLPEMAQLNTQLMDRTERELNDVERDIRVLKERRIYLLSELGQINPSSTVLSEEGEKILSPAGRLKALEAERIKLIAVYSNKHPDILRIEKEIKALKLEVGETDNTDNIKDKLMELNTQLTAAKDRYSISHPTVKRLEKVISELESAYRKKKSDISKSVEYKADLEADNPAYIQLKTQLQATESELQSLNESAKKLKIKLAEFEHRLMETPRIESTYNMLTRDYQNATMEYRELKAKQMEAQLSESMEIGRKGERFTLIEPPLLPERPIKPNRIAILLLGALFSLLAGLGGAFLMDAIDGNMHGRKAVYNALGEYPLVSIPYIMTQSEVSQRVKMMKLSVVAIIAMLVVLALLFHFIVMPLDTFWFVILRRLGV